MQSKLIVFCGKTKQEGQGIITYSRRHSSLRAKSCANWAVSLGKISLIIPVLSAGVHGLPHGNASF